MEKRKREKYKAKEKENMVRGRSSLVKVHEIGRGNDVLSPHS